MRRSEKNKIAKTVTDRPQSRGIDTRVEPFAFPLFFHISSPSLKNIVLTIDALLRAFVGPQKPIMHFNNPACCPRAARVLAHGVHATMEAWLCMIELQQVRDHQRRGRYYTDLAFSCLQAKT